MLAICKIKRNNPYTVNVITFSCHGITYNKDAIAVISEEQKGEDGDVKIVFRFINISHWARKFAAVSNTITVFLMSMC
jgi:hypothetical protein